MEKRLGKNIGIGIFWLILWQVTAMLVDNSILFIGPLETLASMRTLVGEETFWFSVFNSYVKIMWGFLLATFTGVILASLSVRSSLVKEFLSPFLQLLKAIPVASFVVLFLIWFRSPYLSTAVVFAVVLPMIYFPMMQALEDLRQDLEEMARVFQFSFLQKTYYITYPQMKGKIKSCLGLALGMSFKSGVASEIIGSPVKSIGQQMYLSRLTLNTAELFSYTAVVILLAYLSDRGIKLLFFLWDRYGRKMKKQLGKKETVSYKKDASPCPESIAALNIRMGYGNREVLRGDYIFYKGKLNEIGWPSGAGKTTLLRLFAGLETPWEGTITRPFRVGMLFQEDRLLEEESAFTNVALVCSDHKKVLEHLERLLPGEDYEIPVKEYSGGMKRRVAILRAMLWGSHVVLLDEPYNGLDLENRKRVEKYLYEEIGNRILLIANHDCRS